MLRQSPCSAIKREIHSLSNTSNRTRLYTRGLSISNLITLRAHVYTDTHRYNQVRIPPCPLSRKRAYIGTLCIYCQPQDTYIYVHIFSLSPGLLERRVGGVDAEDATAALLQALASEARRPGAHHSPRIAAAAASTSTGRSLLLLLLLPRRLPIR